MISSNAKTIIDATLPVVLENGTKITRHFYRRMFEHNPELKNLFNLGNQESGEQAQALAGSVYAFASTIDRLDEIETAMNRIAQKHVSLGITPTQYTIVGRHLLASIAEVLGAAVTPDVAAAWDEVYWLMACNLISREAKIYRDLGWLKESERKRVKVVGKDVVSADAISLSLEIEDDRLQSFLPGQYVSVAVNLPEVGITQVRQYSLSDSPSTRWRITVKRVEAADGAPAGAVSNYLHQSIDAGDFLEIGPACGDFTIPLGGRSLVMISAGVGITPMVSMIKYLASTKSERGVVFAHAARSRDHFPHFEEVRTAIRSLRGARLFTWYEDSETSPSDAEFPGRMDLSAVGPLPADADYLLCGPLAFMKSQREWLVKNDVSGDRIHYEVFGPDIFGQS